MQGVIPEQAERAVRYLTKYLTKAIAQTFTASMIGRPRSLRNATALVLWLLQASSMRKSG